MKIVFFLVSFLVCIIAQAAVPAEGWYSGLMLSGTNLSGLKFNLFNPLTRRTEFSQISYKPAIGGGGQIGYRYSKARFEMQFYYDNNTINRVLIGDLSLYPTSNYLGLNGTGNTRFFAAMFNVFYEIYPEDREIRLAPYLGLGIGYASINNSYCLFRLERELIARNESASAPMGQAIAGINYFFTDSCSAGVDFRYMSTPNHQQLNSSVSVSSVNFIVNLSFT